jgi:hypothetical protein
LENACSRSAPPSIRPAGNGKHLSVPDVEFFTRMLFTQNYLHAPAGFSQNGGLLGPSLPFHAYVDNSCTTLVSRGLDLGDSFFFASQGRHAGQQRFRNGERFEAQQPFPQFRQ